MQTGYQKVCHNNIERYCHQVTSAFCSSKEYLMTTAVSFYEASYTPESQSSPSPDGLSYIITACIETAISSNHSFKLF